MSKKTFSELMKVKDGNLGGVLGGLSNYLGWNATLLRFAFAAICLFIGGSISSLLITSYIILYFVMPDYNKSGLIKDTKKEVIPAEKINVNKNKHSDVKSL